MKYLLALALCVATAAPAMAGDFVLQRRGLFGRRVVAVPVVRAKAAVVAVPVARRAVVAAPVVAAPIARRVVVAAPVVHGVQAVGVVNHGLVFQQSAILSSGCGSCVLGY